MKNNIIDKITDGIRNWVSLNLLLILMMLIVRIIFFVETALRINTPSSEFLNIILGFKYDLILASHFIAWISLVFLIFFYFFPKTTVKIYKIFIYIFAVTSTLLTEYFCNLMSPLDHVIFTYSVESLKGTIQSSSSFSIVPIVFLAISVILFILISQLWKKIKIGNVVSYLILIVSIFISISFNYGNIIRTEKYAESHYEFILATNQIAYSYVSIHDFLNKDDVDEISGFEVIEAAASVYQKKNIQNTYPYLDYPFYRKSDYRDVLGTFLDKTTNDKKPNFVFIILESFGQSLTGVETPTISFTPYIDSLKNESLYWKNCLSATERTFGVLPTIFASTPHGAKGFADRYRINHNSLLKDFKRNGYDISYYYGCYRDVDRYDKFLNVNNLDKIFIPEQGNVDEEIYNLMYDNHRWGLDDKELYDIAVKSRKSSDNDKPFVDILMSLSTHEPFIILDGQEKYEQKVKEILENSTTVSKKERTIISKNLNVFACYLYMDECVRNLINAYKEMDEYENTIFVITGDHRMGMLTTGNVLRSFNVPLLIYSPLLNKNKQMKAVVSHYDITPTINAYLSNNYDYTVDEYCHWLGTSLDTVTEFRNLNTIAFMLNNKDVVNYLDKEYFLSRSKLYRIEEDLSLTSIDNPHLYNVMKNDLDNYNLLSKYVLNMNSLDCIGGSELTEIADYNYDIDNTSDKVFKNLVVDSLDNKFVRFDKRHKYISLYPYLEIDEDYKKFLITVSFDLQTYTETKPPFLVYSIGDFYGTALLVSMQGENLNTGKLEHYIGRMAISGDESFKGEKLKIYFSNTDGNTMMFDNIKINIKASK